MRHVEGRYRIGVAEFFHETNVYSADVTTTNDFRAFRLFEGQEILRQDRNTRTFTAGMIGALDGMTDALAVPLVAAAALPSGPIQRDTYADLLARLKAAIQREKIDGLCIALHGAAMSEDFTDLDGEILRELRLSVGVDAPLVATLDLHGNLTAEMCNSADALFGTNLYPHTDCYERGAEAVECVVAMLRGEISPVAALVRLPMMIAPTTTDADPAKSLMEMCSRLEDEDDRLLECQLFHGFPMTDGPEVGVSVVAVADGDTELALRAANAVATAAWSRRWEFLPTVFDCGEALDRAWEAFSRHGGPVVVNECSDNAGGGTPGDGTHLLREMVRRQLPDSAFGTICDPETAASAHRAGIGATIRVALGGKRLPLYGEPLETDVVVTGLSDGTFVSRTPIWGGMTMRLGPSACLRIGCLDVVVVSVAMQVYDDGPFEINGIDVHAKSIVGLKSNHHFRAWWKNCATGVFTADPPGGTSTRVANLPHRLVRSPIWPRDADLSWDAEAI